MNKHLHRKRHRGATLVFVALWMGIALAALMVLDIGNLFWQKRELQKIADLSALAGATGDLENCATTAIAFSRDNGLTETDPLPTAHAGDWQAITKFDAFLNTSKKNACGVKVERNVPYFFIFDSKYGNARLISAEAIAAQRSLELARLFIRTKILDVDQEKPNAVLLNALVGGLLGGSLKLDAISWKGLLNADVSLLSFLKALEVKLNTEVGNFNELLKTEVDVGVVIDAMIAALQNGERPAVSADIKALEAIRAVALVRPLKLRLAQLVQADLSGENAALDTRLNLFGLLQSVIQVGNKNAAVAADLKVPLGELANIVLNLKIIEPPQWALGIPGQNPPLQAKTAQVQLMLKAKLLGIGVDLDLNAGNGSVTLTDYDCSSIENKKIYVDIKSALLNLKLKLTLLNNDVVSVPLNLLQQNKKGIIKKPILTSTNSAPPSELKDEEWQTIVFNSGILKSLLDSVKETLQETLKSSLGILGSLLGGLLGGVLDLVNLVVSPILDPILSTLLTALGVDLTSTDFAGQLTCGGYQATLVH